MPDAMYGVLHRPQPRDQLARIVALVRGDGDPVAAADPCGVGALIQRGGRVVAGMLTIATAGGS